MPFVLKIMEDTSGMVSTKLTDMKVKITRLTMD